ncbi:MAG: hypothetical protein HQL32_15720 [Planctomycetes bacterium]|nr:hypothetical protein [Planctomycetota bacterium]
MKPKTQYSYLATLTFSVISPSMKSKITLCLLFTLFLGCQPKPHTLRLNYQDRLVRVHYHEHLNNKGQHSLRPARINTPKDLRQISVIINRVQKPHISTFQSEDNPRIILHAQIIEGKIPNAENIQKINLILINENTFFNPEREQKLTFRFTPEGQFFDILEFMK